MTLTNKKSDIFCRNIIQVREKVIHTQNAMKTDKSNLYTKLYTLSTVFYGINHFALGEIRNTRFVKLL